LFFYEINGRLAGGIHKLNNTFRETGLFGLIRLKSLMHRFVFIIFVPALLLISSRVFSQDVSTLNNYTGDWDDTGSWTGGTQPDPLFNDIDNQNILVEGYINVGSYGIDQDMSIATNSNGFDFVIEDTLVIYGDFEFKQNAMDLVVNGYLIVFGNVIFRNRVDVLTNGEIIVKGTLSFVGAQGTYSGDGNVYADDINATGRDNIPVDNQKNLDSLENDYPDIFEFVDGNGQIPLPVEVLYFTAEKASGGVKLSWATLKEENFDYFTLERADQNHDFYELAWIPGRASATGTITGYEFFDELPLRGYSFYRLKATDFDGFTEYHGIVSVRIDDIQELIRIYPNPVEGNRFTINFAGQDGTPFRLLTVMGKVVQEGTIVQGINEIDLLRKLSPGIYLIRFDQGFNPAPRKIFIR
jgi:hypothetical protein